MLFNQQQLMARLKKSNETITIPYHCDKALDSTFLPLEKSKQSKPFPSSSSRSSSSSSASASSSSFPPFFSVLKKQVGFGLADRYEEDQPWFDWTCYAMGELKTGEKSKEDEENEINRKKKEEEDKSKLTDADRGREMMVMTMNKQMKKAQS